MEAPLEPLGDEAVWELVPDGPVVELAVPDELAPDELPPPPPPPPLPFLQLSVEK